jgi:hypothetical protein
MDSIPTPKHYLSYEEHYKSGRKLPESLPVWIAQSKIEDTPSVVTAPNSFTKGGDAEAIVMAINTSKGIDSPVVWRRENYMVWGFYAMPKELTDDGRRLFLNCLAYMAKRGK